MAERGSPPVREWAQIHQALQAQMPFLRAYARGAQRRQSDLDLLVDFDEPPLSWGSSPWRTTSLISSA